MLSIWSEFLKLAKQEVGTQVIETWFKCVTLQKISTDSREVTLCTPNQFVTSWLAKNYLVIINKGLSRLLNVDSVKINFEQMKNMSMAVSAVIDKTSETKLSGIDDVDKILPAKKTLGSQNIATDFQALGIVSAEKNLCSKKDLNAKKVGISSKYRFDSFIVGPHNHLAYSASMAISKGAIKGYNPLFIYGATGLGKTHLLNCIGNETRELRPNAKIVYKTSDKFVDEFIKSIRFDKIDQFKEKYCTTDLLLIDDIQFLSQKEQTQEIFFHIFNSMHQQNKQIVLTSDMQPSQISGLQERLKSRLGWGLIADIAPPAFETRVAILMRKAEDMKIDLSRSVAEKIASKVILNVRELEGTLTRLSTLSILSGVSLADYPIDKEIQNQKPLKDNSKVCPNELMRQVAKFFNVTPLDIKSARREKGLSDARQLVMYLLRENTSFSLKVIGEFVGGKSHSTVLHAIENVKDRLEEDQIFAQQIQALSERVRQKPQTQAA